MEIDENVYQFPNEHIRFAINADAFVEKLQKIGLKLLEPYKEVVVENRHTMGTFMLEKH